MEEKAASTTPMLREFLARHDLRCERCGYNLRNIVEPLCPECGYVIPRPGTDDLNKDLEGTRPEHRLWCIHCRTDVRRVQGEECPGCRKSLALKRTDSISRANARFLPTVGWGYIAVCAICVVQLGWWIALAVARPTVLGGSRLFTGVAAGILPLLILGLWIANRKAIDESGWTLRVQRWSLKFGILCVLVGLARMAR